MTRMPFSVVPVLDLKGGRAVHAIAGRRSQYQPLRSVLHATAEPILLAGAFRDRLHLSTLYLADLDAIEGSTPEITLYRRLSELGPHLWLDAGLRDVASMTPLLELDAASSSLVIGLETVRSPAELGRMIDRAGAHRIIFSLDLFDGRPIGPRPDCWGTAEPTELADRAIERGASRLLILDLSRVGTGRGPGTEALMAHVLSTDREIEVFIGGGISRIEDVVALRQAGASGVLIGSAFHDGRIGLRELAQVGLGGPTGSVRAGS